MDDLKQALDGAVARHSPDVSRGLEGSLEKARRRDRRRKGGTILVAALLFLVPASLLVSGRSGDGDIRTAGSYVDGVPDLTGPSLVQALGLDFTTGPPAGCGWFVDVNGVGGYCLDGHVRSDTEAWEVWHRLAGHVPTEIDRRVNELHESMRATEDAEELDALADELAPLLIEQEREPSWGGQEAWEALLEFEGVQP
jgi:hypothetical protein